MSSGYEDWWTYGTVAITVLPEQDQGMAPPTTPVLPDSGSLDEWQELQAAHAFAAGLVDSLISEQVRLRGEIAELTKQLSEAKGCGVSTADLRATRWPTLTLLPEPDNRLGRGNAAMGES